MVGCHQYDRYIDDDIIEKYTYIYNIVEKSDFAFSSASKSNVVTYVGSIVRVKGFHVLTKNSNKILKEVPNAELFVVGTGNLYNENAKLGRYCIANKKYEEVFMPYLTDKEGNIIPSVHFHGKLGQDKAKIYRNTRIGIINPTARTETFGLGAVKMESYGVPIVL